MNRRFWLAELSLVLMSLIWGVNYIVIKYATGIVSPLAYNAARILLATLALLAVATVWGGARPTRSDAIALVLLGVLGNGIYQVLFIEGVARTRAGEAALVVGASPALMALFGAWRGIERLSARSAIGIAISMAGVGLIVLGRAASGADADAHGGSVVGDLLVLCGSVSWAVYTVLLTPYLPRVSGWWVSASTMMGGLLVLSVVGARAVLATSWTALPSSAWLAMTYSGLGALVVAYILWYYGVRTLGPTRTALYGNLQPIVALVAAWPTLGEVPTAWQGVGAVAIVSGVVLTRVKASEAS